MIYLSSFTLPFYSFLHFIKLHFYFLKFVLSKILAPLTKSSDIITHFNVNVQNEEIFID